MSSTSFPTPVTADLEWITCETADGLAVILIRGAAPISVYQHLLMSVQYSITAQEPDKSVPERNISVSDADNKRIENMNDTHTYTCIHEC